VAKLPNDLFGLKTLLRDPLPPSEKGPVASLLLDQFPGPGSPPCQHYTFPRNLFCASYVLLRCRMSKKGALVLVPPSWDRSPWGCVASGEHPLCANMNETLPPSEFRVEGGEGLGNECLEWSGGPGHEGERG
jgi:hypothetical protein